MTSIANTIEVETIVHDQRLSIQPLAQAERAADQDDLADDERPDDRDAVVQAGDAELRKHEPYAHPLRAARNRSAVARVRDACSRDRATNRRSQALRTHRRLDEFRRAGSRKLHRHPQVIVAADGDDGEGHLPTANRGEQRAQAAVGKVDRSDDAAAGPGVEGIQQVGCRLEVPHVDVTAADRLREALPLDSRLRNDVDGDAQGSLVRSSCRQSSRLDA